METQEEYNPSSYTDSELGFLDNLPAYNVYAGVDRLLDVSREVVTSHEYYPLIVPWPQAQNINIPARGQLSGALIIPKDSILVAITGWSDNGVSPNVTGNQFMLRVFDNVTGNDVFNGTWGWGVNVSPPMEGDLPSSPTPTVFGPYYLSDPYIVLGENSLQATVLNAIGLASNIQVAFHFVVPFKKTLQRTMAVVEGMN